MSIYRMTLRFNLEDDEELSAGHDERFIETETQTQMDESIE